MKTEEDTFTIEEIRRLARVRKVPGPDVDEHDDGYEGECYCRSCLEYAAND